MDTIASSIFSVLFNIINIFISSMFAPIEFLLNDIVSQSAFSDYFTNFYGVINDYVIPSASWFANLVPPNTWGLIVLYFTFMLGFYSVAIVMHYIIKPLSIVKKLVPFS